ncbi:MAG: hypothetical protein ABII12_16175 [Planctomycetota bacterium]
MQEHHSRNRVTCLMVLAMAAMLLSTSGCESDNPLLLEGIDVVGNTINVTVESVFDLLKSLWANSPVT